MGMWDSYQGFGDSFKGMGSGASSGTGDEDIFGMLKQFSGGEGQMNMTGIPGANPSGGSGNPSAWNRGGNAMRSPMSQLRGAQPGGGGLAQILRILQMLFAQSGQGR